mmetsp:Transcript_27984/g.46928  ORF Transcript_27984/g.46928 Transcript_27984/m.46928 type:complete len:204 (+) Transcript_27984:834-1445(+)
MGHSTELGVDLDTSDDLRTQDVSVRVDQKVDTLHDVEVDLVLLVLDVLRTPRDGVGDGRRGTDLDIELVTLLCDVLLEDLGLGDLGVSKVHHLVQKLVDDDKVVPDALLLNLLKILLEHVDGLVQEHQDHGGVGVSVGDSQEIDVVGLDVDVGDTVLLGDGLHVEFLLLHDAGDESLGAPERDVSTVVSADEDFALGIEDEDR